MRRQAEQAVRIYFVNFLQRTDWHRQPAAVAVDEQQRSDPLATLDELRAQLGKSEVLCQADREAGLAGV